MGGHLKCNDWKVHLQLHLILTLSFMYSLVSKRQTQKVAFQHNYLFKLIIKIIIISGNRKGVLKVIVLHFDFLIVETCSTL